MAAAAPPSPEVVTTRTAGPPPPVGASNNLNCATDVPSDVMSKAEYELTWDARTIRMLSRLGSAPHDLILRRVGARQTSSWVCGRKCPPPGRPETLPTTGPDPLARRPPPPPPPQPAPSSPRPRKSSYAAAATGGVTTAAATSVTGAQRLTNDASAGSPPLLSLPPQERRTRQALVSPWWMCGDDPRANTAHTKLAYFGE